MAKEELDRLGRSELHYAAVKGDVSEVTRLVRAGADVNLQDKNGFTPLHGAAQQHMLDVARIVVDAGAEINGKIAMAIVRFSRQSCLAGEKEN